MSTGSLLPLKNDGNCPCHRMKEDHVTWGKTFGLASFSFKSVWIDGVVWYGGNNGGIV